MDADDLDPPPRAAALPPFAPRPLEAMGLDELATYIAALEAEITRAREMIAAKSDARSGAESLFKR